MINSRSFVTISLDALEYNIVQIKNRLPQNANIMAVIKGDAFGYGAIAIAHKLNQIGIFNFAVASFHEAKVLRENNIVGEILILGTTYGEDINLLGEYNLTQAIISYSYIHYLEKYIKMDIKIKVHIKINTGLNRFGLNISDIDRIIQLYNNKFEVHGIFTHLGMADKL